jgi:hypothetical protein
VKGGAWKWWSTTRPLTTKTWKEALVAIDIFAERAGRLS